jgi:hypothetical protein
VSFLTFLKNMLQKIDVNQLVSAAESQLTQKIVAKILLSVAAPSWLAGPLGWFLGLVVGWIVNKGDLVAYKLGNGWQNTNDGKTLEEKANARNELVKAGASPEAIAKAIQEQKDAFDRLMDG